MTSRVHSRSPNAGIWTSRGRRRVEVTKIARCGFTKELDRARGNSFSRLVVHRGSATHITKADTAVLSKELIAFVESPRLPIRMCRTCEAHSDTRTGPLSVVRVKLLD